MAAELSMLPKNTVTLDESHASETARRLTRLSWPASDTD